MQAKAHLAMSFHVFARKVTMGQRLLSAPRVEISDANGGEKARKRLFFENIFEWNENGG